MDNLPSFSALEALELIKSNVVLWSNINSFKQLFYPSKNKSILVLAKNARYKLGYDQFLELFQDNTFFVLDSDNEVEIDPEKDKEYYSWRQ